MNRINRQPSNSEGQFDRSRTEPAKKKAQRAEAPRVGDEAPGRKDFRDTLTLESAVKAVSPLKQTSPKVAQPTPSRPKAILSGVIGGGLKKLAGLLGVARDADVPAKRPIVSATKSTGARVAAISGAKPASGRSDALMLARRKLDDFIALGGNTRAPHDVFLSLFGDLNKAIAQVAGQDAEVVAATRRVTTTLRAAAREGFANAFSPHTAAGIGTELEALFDLYDARKPGLPAATRETLEKTMISVATTLGGAVLKHGPARQPR